MSETKYNVNPSTFDEYILTNIETYDVRFPMFLNNSGGDAACSDPDFSSAYIMLIFKNKYNNNNKEIIGHGLTFSLGRGNEILCHCMRSLFPFVQGMSFGEIILNPLIFSRKLSCDGQMRWLGPEKGVIHMACSAYNNAIFDLWSWCYNKPLWQFLIEMDIETLVNKCIDFQYLTDVINPLNIINQLKENKLTINNRLNNLNKNGYPLYAMAGWMGYSDEKIKQTCKQYLSNGVKAFKMKVGRNINDDIRRAKLIRSCIGDQCKLMMDVNQQWEVNTAIEWMKKLSFCKPYWIEEPTSPDDIIGHKTIKTELNKLNIGIATGEVASNRVIFKQFLQANAIDFANPDAARLNSVFEVLPVLIMCNKFKIPAIFHAGAAGLNEMVRHYVMLDYLLISCTLKDRMCEYSQHLSDNFEEEMKLINGKYYPPKQAGFVRLKMSSIEKYKYPNGYVWKNKLKSNL